MISEHQPPDWKVLLIGGNSGSGKTTVAREIARHFDVPWLQVDDFRLVLQHNIDREQNQDLHHFDDIAMVYQHSPERLVEWRIAAAEATSRAVEVVVANHGTFGGPAILEGDDIVPALATQRVFAGTPVQEEDLLAVFLIEDDATAIEANLAARGRDFTGRPAAECRNQIEMSVRYGEWLRREAERLALPVVSPRPRETVFERVLTVICR